MNNKIQEAKIVRLMHATKKQEIPGPHLGDGNIKVKHQGQHRTHNE